MQLPVTIEALFTQPHFILLECVSGSHAYGLNRPGSDRDLRGIYAVPAVSYLSLSGPPLQLSDAKNDVIFYSLKRFAELAMASNPNMLELLFSPEDCRLRVSKGGHRLIQSRQIFLSRACHQSHVAYANAQIQKARGQNKWVNRPQPEAPPRQEDFCWFLPAEAARQNPPMRPVRLADSGVRLEECHAAGLEHSSEFHRLYHYGPQARGVFRGGNMVVESIPLEDESPRFIGLLLFNRNAYESAQRDHKNYWTWRSERNPARWEQQESGERDYDAKNMMHTFRLLMAAEFLLKEGTLRVRFEGKDRAFLLSIREGEHSYEKLIAEAERRTAELEGLLAKSPLPETPNTIAVEELLLTITEEWEHEHR